MMKEQPLVSVLMTAYNREQYITEAIESVLASTYTSFELIIVDDCSTDKTVEIARWYEEKDKRVKVYVNEQNLGDYPNRNKAASYAKGKYIKYLDSDDVIYAHCLQVMVNAMEKFQGAGYGLSAMVDQLQPYPSSINSKTTYLEHFNGYGHFDRAPGSSIIRKEAFDDVGGFSGKRMIGDNELWFKLSRYYSLVKLPRDLVWNRVHEGQESQNKYAKKYRKLRNRIKEEALHHYDCPLEDTEIMAIRKAERIKQLKRIVLSFLKFKSLFN